MKHFFADSIRKSFQGKPLLNDIHLQLQTGDILGIVGRNGCGKSTLFQILFGSMPADQSYMKLDTQVIKKRRELQRIFSFAPQFVYLPPSIKVRHLIHFSVAEDPLLAHQLDSPIGQLSKGVQLYLQTLYALYLPQPFCLLDEPFAALSPLTQEYLSSQIRKTSLHKGLVITDHQTSLLKDICTHRSELIHGCFKPLSDIV